MVCRGSPAMHGHFLKRLQSYVLFCNKANSWCLIFQNISSADIFDKNKKMCYLCMLNRACAMVAGL